MTQTWYCLRVLLCLFVVTALPPAASSAAPAGGPGADRRDAAQPSHAARDSSGWQAVITGHSTTPPRIVAVDKTRQTLFLFERHSPLRVAGQYACTTGQADGDKLVRGDLKTPEGIYFVSQKLSSGLDFVKYGNEAYTLNYPNPVDRLRKKTGYGIWIHGRGTPIIPKETQGCVAMNNGDIAVLGKELLPGTPVALASAVNFSPVAPAQDKNLLASLEKRTYAWAKAWTSRSRTMFDYYDPEAYGIAQGESFSAFRAQKERLFKQLPWIDTRVRDVQTLQGPGYWVTWFQQDYRAPNLSAKGVRRLYWQRDARGEMRIVGMEWAPHLSGTLIASLGGAGGEAANPPVEASPRSEEDMPAGRVPAPVASAAQAAPAAPAAPAAQAAPADPAAAAEKAAVEGAAFIEAWRKAWESGDRKAYMACYDKNAVQGARKGAAAIEEHKRTVWAKNPPRRVKLNNVRITVTSGGIAADMFQEYADTSGFADKGVKTLNLKRTNASWRITQEEWSPHTP